MFDTYDYYSKKEVVSDVEQPVYGTNDRGKEEKQYTMGVLSLSSNTGTSDTGSGGNSGTGGTGNNTDTGGTGNNGSADASPIDLGITPKDIFDASSARKADMLKAIGDYYTGTWYDNTDTHQFNSYGFTPLMMATQAQCYESIEYILDKIAKNTDDENKNKFYTAVHQLHEKITDSDSSRRNAIKIAEDNDDEKAIEYLLTKYKAFIKIDDSNKVADDITLYVERKYYDVLNALYKSEQLDLEDSNNNTIENASENASVILTAVYSNDLNKDKLEGWHWWDGASIVTLSFENSKDKEFTLPGDKIYIKDSKAKLPEITEIYKDNDNIKWEATDWAIGKSKYEFGSTFIISEETVATLMCAKVKVTLTFKNNTELEVSDLPTPVTCDCGDPVTLPKLNNEYKDNNNDKIRWEAIGWTIDGKDYDPGTEYKIYDNIDAFVKLERVKVILTYIKDYSFEIPNFPSTKEYPCGDPVTLPNFAGKYKDEDKIKWEAKGWTVNDKFYDFDSSFNIYENTTAKLKCEKAKVTLTFINPYKDDVTIELDPISADSGTKITLPKPGKDEYENNDFTKLYKPLKWIINGSEHAFGASYTIYDSTDATLVCDDEVIPIGIIFDTSKLELTEGEFTYVNFKLASIPKENVLLDLESSSDRLSISPSRLVFSNSNWDIDHSVLFEAKDNDVDELDDPITVTVSMLSSSGDDRYNDLSYSLSVTVLDNDTAGIEYNNSLMRLVEDTSVTRAFRLNSQPTANVTLTLSARLNNSGIAPLTIRPSTLTFMPSNWNTEQYVDFIAHDNDVANNDVPVTVTIASTSDDPKYKFSRSLDVTIINDDTVGIIFNDLRMDLKEGLIAKSRTFKLNSQPTGNVILTISSNIANRLYIGKSQLSTTTSVDLEFTASKWDIEQTVWFRAINDSESNGDATGTVNVIASSTDDTKYNLSSFFNITVEDNDVAPGITYNNTDMELNYGETVVRTFKLNSQPNSDVNIYFTYDDTLLTIDSPSFSIEPSKWGALKRVNFAAKNNSNDQVKVGIKTTSSDPNYNDLEGGFMVNIKEDNTVKFGTLAFVSGYFAVDINPTDKLPYTQKGEQKPLPNNTPEYLVDVKTQWNSVYKSDTDYTVYQVPRSPHWTSTNEVFNYDLIYDANINVDDE